MTPVVFRCDRALVGDGWAENVDIHCAAGLIVAIEPTGTEPRGTEVERTADVIALPGVVLPGFADAHSHVFHRALRGRTHGAGAQGGSFWTWRDQMYRLADRLDPDSLHELAVAAYTEMVCAGVTAVGEFHYLHHGPGGRRYADPNELGMAVVQAGRTAGLAVTLLDVAYLAGGFGKPVSEVQQRFSDGTVAAWADRIGRLPADVRTGVAIHSVRAVAVSDLPAVAESAAGRVLHVHLSEQPAENADCLAATGRTPTQLLADAGALGDRTAAVHATHLTAGDIDLLGGSGATVVICPTTEADLADGLPAAGALARAGAVLALGGDQHVAVDPFGQARGLEYGERLATGVRGNFSPMQLLRAAAADSHRAIGSPAGALDVGAPADLVAVDPASVRTAGSLGEQVVMTASAADVAVVVIGGIVQARAGVHTRLGDPGPLLAAAIDRAWAS